VLLGAWGKCVVVIESFIDDDNDNPTVGTAQATFEDRQADEASPTPSEPLVDALTTVAIG